MKLNLLEVSSKSNYLKQKNFFLERLVYKESDLSISYGLSLNGRLFLAPSDHLDALVCKQKKLVKG